MSSEKIIKMMSKEILLPLRIRRRENTLEIELYVRLDFDQFVKYLLDSESHLSSHKDK